MKMKKLFALTLVLVLLCSCLTFVGCKKDEEVDTSIKFDRIENSSDGYAAIYLPEGRALKVLQLTDPQVDTSKKYRVIGGSNDLTYTFIEALLTATAPDFVIITGDLVMSTLESNQRYLLRYAEVLEKFEIPWTVTFGNHDSEGYWVSNFGAKQAHPLDSEKATLFGQISKKDSVELLTAYPHCLLSAGDGVEAGTYGDNFINIKDKDGSILHTVCTLDTPYSEDMEDYSIPATEAQIDWYKKSINKISDLAYGTDRAADKVVPSYIYQHVGVPEFRIAWNEAWNNGEPNDKYFYGNCPSGNYSSHISEDDLFETAVDLGSTKAIFYGHHHDNDASVEYKGIRLTFGQHSGFAHTYRINRIDEDPDSIYDDYKKWDYTYLDKYGDFRGGTMLNLAADGSFNIEPKYAKDVIPDYSTDFAIDPEAIMQSLLADGCTVIRWTEAEGTKTYEPEA